MRKLAGIVLIVEGKILLVLSSKHKEKYDKKKWSIPKGKIDLGETPFEAAERELKEECGISLEKLGLEEQDCDDEGEIRYFRRSEPASLRFFVYDIPKIKLTSAYMDEGEISGFGFFEESVASHLMRSEQVDLTAYIELDSWLLAA